MKVLDLPDEQDNPIREILLKQDDNTLLELSKKSKREIQNFLIQARKTEKDLKSNELNIENQKLDVDIKKIKSVFTPQILEKNPDIADEFQKLDSEKDNKNKDEILQSILTTLKDPKRLKTIIDQL
ncbi:MAG: hypothetical protein CJD30_10965 [Sulfuricurvum sp. PD_MW2]|uniref:hypothetical protein n=1 Tax=Sulfuricurvum sp. PD_MW2 TaxID=2027917 RepID=UPI000C05F951|nr:hypothetical protein [Sulfuricurvum sp. PD_MW2]PHM16569.1 MAG: hypothetical protein CJD30_10965 [Sulfuricurvum sp. PD_MW2]